MHNSRKRPEGHHIIRYQAPETGGNTSSPTEHQLSSMEGHLDGIQMQLDDLTRRMGDTNSRVGDLTGRMGDLNAPNCDFTGTIGAPY